MAVMIEVRTVMVKITTKFNLVLSIVDETAALSR